MRVTIGTKKPLTGNRPVRLNGEYVGMCVLLNRRGGARGHWCKFEPVGTREEWHFDSLADLRDRFAEVWMRNNPLKASAVRAADHIVSQG